MVNSRYMILIYRWRVVRYIVRYIMIYQLRQFTPPGRHRSRYDKHTWIYILPAKIMQHLHSKSCVYCVLCSSDGFSPIKSFKSFRVNHLWWVYASDSENITKRHVGPKHYRFIHPWLGFLGWSNLSPAIMLLCLSPTVYIYIYKYSWLNPMWIKKITNLKQMVLPSIPVTLWRLGSWSIFPNYALCYS